MASKQGNRKRRVRTIDVEAEVVPSRDRCPDCPCLRVNGVCLQCATNRRASTRVDARPLAVKPPPDVYVPLDAKPGREEAYVRLPFSPEVVGALKEHAENGARLYELVTGTGAAATDIIDAIRRTAVALERDVGKIRARRKRRR